MSCRLFVILARDAQVAVVLRRGPSRWCHVVAWDTRSDTFTEGAWFRGRIYETRCDVSPDGTLLLAFFHGGSWRPGYTDAWTAVSRLPWLHALGLWPSGTTYGGGGRFTSNRDLMLRTGMPVRAHPDHPGLGLRVSNGTPPLHGTTGEPGTDWSGVDQEGRGIATRGGKILRRDPRGRDVELVDLEDRTPEPEPAPAWATAPLEAARARAPKRSRR